jgi:hypothetical protein
MKKWLVIFCCVLISSCSSVSIEDYAAEQPVLDLNEFFSVPVEAWGMFQDRSGQVIKRFHVDISSHREDEKLILDERFVYSDGSTERRVWTLTPDGEKRWKGTADDVVGEAIGELAGNALRWRYQLILPVDDTTYVVTFDDWMFLMDRDTMINRASMSKLGVELGQVTLFFRRQADITAP